jgi:tRNA nucleotidyltransferase (CCA-adding enzyme)
MLAEDAAKYAYFRVDSTESQDAELLRRIEGSGSGITLRELVAATGMDKERAKEAVMRLDRSLKIIRAFRDREDWGTENYYVSYEPEVPEENPCDEIVEKAIRAYAPSLQRISAERIHAELEKLLLSDRPQDLRIAWETGITAMVLPEFDRIMKQEQTGPHHDLTAGEHTLLAMQKVPATRVLRFCMLLHDMGKPETASVDADGVWHFKGHAEAGAAKAERILKRLKFDNDSLRRIVRLVRAHSTHVKPEPEAVRRAVHEIGEDIFEEYLLVRRADILAQKPGTQEERLEKLAAAEHIYREILEKGECLSLKTLAVSGADLIADGMRPGKEIGRVLGQLLDDVLTWPEHNEREYLLKKSRSLR